MVAGDVQDRNGPIAKKAKCAGPPPDVTCENKHVCPIRRCNRPSAWKPVLKMLQVHVGRQLNAHDVTEALFKQLPE